MIERVGFAIVSLVTLIAALGVVRSRDLIRAVMWLALALLGTAVLYLMLQAPFLAGVQVLTYVGGVVTLALFGVMVTQRHAGGTIAAENSEITRGVIAALAVFGVLAWGVLRSDLRGEAYPATASAAELGRALLTRHVLAFEVASLLLLAAIIGAAVIARRREPGAVGRGVRE